MKKGDGKKRFVHEFAILAILVVSVGILFFYSSINFTGFAVFSEYENQTSCEAAGYTWEDITEQNTSCVQCETGCVQSYTETLCAEGCQQTCDVNATGCIVCETGCVQSYTETLCAEGCQQTCEEIVTGGQCVGDVCDAEHLSLCLDETACTGASGYWYDDACNAEEQCVPETCESLDACGSVDDECGGTLECGACDETTSSSDEETDNEEIRSTTIISTNPASTTSACVQDWQCGEWQECIEGTQVRVCTDINECGSEEGIPATSQACTVPIVETCEDGVQNQDETGVDCGGSTCNQCSILALMGNSIAGTGKFIFEGMFGNVTKSVISISVLVFIIAGAVFGFFFFKKKKNPLQLISGLFKFKNKKVDVSKLETY
ncbi:MAG: hypothetical protein M1416_00285 [Candidatus Pacearchaeota archaeon]|nr:hypothetical protein [Candidatus Pacearchaeota archaeon]